MGKWKPYVVAGIDPAKMHRLMAEVMDGQLCARDWGDSGEGSEVKVQENAERPRWPMIVSVRSPKGWTGPKEVDGHKVEGFWRAHQIPLPEVKTNPKHLKQLEQWLKSYEPQKLYDAKGRLIEVA